MILSKSYSQVNLEKGSAITRWQKLLIQVEWMDSTPKMRLENEEAEGKGKREERRREEEGRGCEIGEGAEGGNLKI